MASRSSTTLLRPLRLPSTKSALLIKSALLVTCVLLAIFFYFPVLPNSHGHLPTRHTLQPALVSQHLWPTHDAATPTPENVDQACSEHGFTAYQQKNGTRPRRVYDVFPFLLEL